MSDIPTTTLDEITVTAERPDTSNLNKPGTQQYDRKISLKVSDATGTKGLDLSEFRITFTVQRGDIQIPNTADIRVYNLNRETARTVAAPETTQLVLQAGYPGNFGIIFMGTITQARIGRESQTDTYVDFTAADGDEAYNYATMTAPLSAGANIAGRALAGFLQAMKSKAVKRGHVPPLSQDGNFRGRVYHGNVRDELRDFAASNDMLWSIQDGELTLIPQTSYIAGDPVVVSPDTGLIGTPEQTQNGLNVVMLLNPSIKIGTSIKLASDINLFRYGVDLESRGMNLFTRQSSTKLNADGLYYVMAANHRGDTRGNTWYTDATCLAIDASVPLSEDLLKQSTPDSTPIRRF